MRAATPIRAGLRSTSVLQPLVQDGISALAKSHRDLIAADVRDGFADSLDIDEAFREGHDTENRWDYLLGHRSSARIVALEPHSAHDKEVSVVIRKRARSLEHLRDHLKSDVKIAEWFWVASGRVDFTAFDKAMTRLADNGIAFVGRQLLAKRLSGGRDARPRKARR